MEENVDEVPGNDESINNLPTNPDTIKKEDSPETEQNKKILIEAMVENRGNITNACKAAKCGRSTYYEYEKSDKEFKKACRDVVEINLDFVEDKLFKSIERDDLSSIYFYLKCKGKKRGYVEGQINYNAELNDEEKQKLKIGDFVIDFGSGDIND